MNWFFVVFKNGLIFNVWKIVLAIFGGFPMIQTLKPPPMTIAQLINHLNNIENKEKEILFTDIATNYKYKIFTIDKKNGDIIIEDTEE